MTKMIGILAGMGPQSTAPFISLVVEQCQKQYGAKNDIDFPPMMIYSLPTPFYLDRPIDDAKMRRTLIAGLRHLESTGVDFIAMPCNSVHKYYPEIAAQIEVPLLNMIDITVQARPESVKRLALLATRFTVAAGLYQAEAAKYGVEMLVSEDWQTTVDSVLTLIDEGQIDTARSHWNDLLTHLEAAKVDAAVVACTDLNVVSAGGVSRLPLLDSALCLARATVARWRAPD
jgi:aspartate racemase